jgi:hypothetical protein
MGASKVYSTLLFPIAACVAVFLALFPKFGAVVQTFPQGVLGGLTIVLFGLIATLGGRIWVASGVDFSENRNLLTAAVSILLGAGMVNGVAIKWGPVVIDGIGASTIAAICLWQLLRTPREWWRLFSEKGYWLKEIEVAARGGVVFKDLDEEEEAMRMKEDEAMVVKETAVSTLVVQEQMVAVDKARADPLGSVL